MRIAHERINTDLSLVFFSFITKSYTCCWLHKGFIEIKQNHCQADYLPVSFLIVVFVCLFFVFFFVLFCFLLSTDDSPKQTKDVQFTCCCCCCCCFFFIFIIFFFFVPFSVGSNSETKPLFTFYLFL